MSVNATSGIGSGASAAPGTGPKQLGKDDFLKLMLKQLQYQDPLAPMQDQQFIAQMAQFSALEQMANVATGLEKLRTELQMVNTLGLANGLIGSAVTYKDADGSEMQGVVSGFEMANGVTQLKVGDRLIALDKIIKVSK